MELTETIKSKVCSDIKAYITGEWKEQTKNKFAEELSAEIEKATEDQFHFGNPPSYERGYLRGNITATGGRNDGDVEYTRTINVDLKTQEFTFFDIDEDDGRARKMCERACKSVSFMKNSFYTWEKIKDSSKKQGIYTCDNYDEALQDFAESECEEAFYRINLYLKDCRIKEATYFETKPMQICHYYPVYFDTTDKKGRTTTINIGYYNAHDDEMDYYIEGDSGILGTLLIILGFIAVVTLYIVLQIKLR